MSAARATIVAVPRERFSMARESLQSIYANTAEPFDLVYVDGGSPRPLKSWLEQQAAERGFRLIRHDGYLTPTKARNIGVAAARTEYVVFVDNDVVVKPGWLGKLIECADETGGAVVGPLTCENGFDRVHFAGGEVEIREEHEDGEVVRNVRDRMYLAQRKLEKVAGELERREVELCEFHCVLVRRDALEKIGGLDEGLMNTREHLDFCLEIARSGGSVWIEPEAVVAYYPPPPLKASDMHFFMLRWSDEWERRSLEYFRDKWELNDNEFFRNRLSRLGWRRQALIVGEPVGRMRIGPARKYVAKLGKGADRMLNRALTRSYRRKHEGLASG